MNEWDREMFMRFFSFGSKRPYTMNCTADTKISKMPMYSFDKTHWKHQMYLKHGVGCDGKCMADYTIEYLTTSIILREDRQNLFHG